MTVSNRLFSGATTQPPTSGLPLAGIILPLAKQAADWIATAANYYIAAAVYEQLSKLSDAELRRRGLSRATLARDVCADCDRADLSR